MDAAPSLAGVRVLGVEHYISGPFCTQLLADQGADVIKVESPNADPRNKYFQTFNRNKRSIVLDLKSEPGKTALTKLVESADVLVTNFAAGVPDRLGYGYEQLKAINPQLVYVHITGFGHNSPYRDLPAFDGVIQAMSGLMDLTGDPNGPPMLSGLFIPDHLTGMWAAMAVAFGLHRRNATGTGNFSDISMLDGLVSFHASSFMELLQMGKTSHRVGSKVRGSFASTYQAKDGWVFLAPLTSRMWAGVTDVIGRPELFEYFPEADILTDTRMDHRDLLDEAIEEWTRKNTTDDVVSRMRAAGVAGSSIYTVEDLVDDPHIKARNMVRTIPDLYGQGQIYVAGSPLPSTDASFTVPPPDVGQHTDEILRELGLPAST